MVAKKLAVRGFSAFEMTGEHKIAFKLETFVYLLIQQFRGLLKAPI